MPDGELAFDLRYAGQSHELTVRACPPSPALREAFERLHEERYGYRDPDAEVELVTVRATRREPGPDVALGGEGAGVSETWRAVHLGGAWHEARVLRGEPGADRTVAGPAVVELPEATVVVPPGWSGRWDGDGTLTLERGRHERDRAAGRRRRAARRLRGDGRGACASAHSANIKERRDCSTGAVRRRRRDGHAGRAHPGAPRGDARRGGRGARRGPRPRGLVGAQRPVPRRHPPARHHGDHAGLRRRRRAAGLRRQPRAPRRRRRPSAGLDARGLDDARRGGRA